MSSWRPGRAWSAGRRAGRMLQGLKALAGKIPGGPLNALFMGWMLWDLANALGGAGQEPGGAPGMEGNPAGSETLEGALMMRDEEEQDQMAEREALQAMLAQQRMGGAQRGLL